VTNCNHHRASTDSRRFFSPSLRTWRDIFRSNTARIQKSWRHDQVCKALTVIGIEGAVAGEIVLHYARGGTLIVGDA
jgi:hypothetical protein